MSRLSIFVCVLLLVVVSEALLKLPSTTTTTTKASCRYWCKKRLTGRTYCCDEEVDNSGEKSGICPPVRDFCPQSFRPGSRPPAECSRDNECGGKDKCCYDICLQHRTCKPSQVAVEPLSNTRH